MVNPTYEKLGSAPSMIRELFAYGLRRSAEVGPENVFDYSLGNPSIPAPQPVQQALLDVLHDTDPIQVHGYSMAGGFDGTRPLPRPRRIWSSTALPVWSRLPTPTTRWWPLPPP